MPAPTKKRSRVFTRDQNKARIKKFLAEGYSFAAACQAADISKSMAYEYRADDPSFNEICLRLLGMAKSEPEGEEWWQVFIAGYRDLADRVQAAQLAKVPMSRVMAALDPNNETEFVPDFLRSFDEVALELRVRTEDLAIRMGLHQRNPVMVKRLLEPPEDASKKQGPAAPLHFHVHFEEQARAKLKARFSDSGPGEHPPLLGGVQEAEG